MYTAQNIPVFQTQVEETIYLLENTVKPDTFFSRYDFLILTLTRLIEADKSNKKPAQMLAEYKNEQTCEKIINKLIERSHERLLKEASNMKTEKGRVSKINKYFDEMEKFSKKMYSSNLALIEDKKKQHNL